MARSLNKVMLIGNVGAEPEARMTSSGTKLVKLSLATSRKWGDGQERTEWHRLTAWGKLADIVEQYVHKGDRLYVEGRIEYSETESDGVKRYWTDIVVQEMVMLGAGSGGQDGGGFRDSSGGGFSDRASGSSAPDMSQPDDDLPF